MTPDLHFRHTSVSDRVREACAWVAERARFVRIDEQAIPAYAKGLLQRKDEDAPIDSIGAPPAFPTPEEDGFEAAAAFVICMNAINFGSGWWPTIRKRPGHSGYATIAAGMGERFRSQGSWTARELTEIDATAIASVLGQAPAHPLMAQFAAALRDVGAHVLADHGGRYLSIVEQSLSAPAVAALLAKWDAFADVSIYGGREVPFYKRAQLAAADLNRAGVAELPDVNHLTAFADNLVPHVFRVDGILQLDLALTARIEAEELLLHGSLEEVELRACAVHAVELLAAATDTALSPAEIDSVLWNRGRGRRYKSLPRPRSRNTAY